MSNTELQEHIAFAEWLRYKGIPFFHPANGGKRSIIQATLLKKMGVLPGVPDFIILKAPKGYRGIAIEMKRAVGNSTVSASQKAVMSMMSHEGWLVFVAYGFANAKKYIEGLEPFYKMPDWDAGPPSKI